MALSDELLVRREKLSRVRSRLRRVVAELDLDAAFLVDEEGNPFGAVGHVEFSFPHPLAGLMQKGSGDAVLKALVGEAEGSEPSPYLVERVGPRALVILVFDVKPRSRRERRQARERLHQLAEELAPLL